MDVDGTIEKATKAKAKVSVQKVPKREKAKGNPRQKMENQIRRENQKVTQKARAVESQMVQGKARMPDQMSHAINVANMDTMHVTVGVVCDRFKTMVSKVLRPAHQELWLDLHRLHLHSCLLLLSPIVLQEFSFQINMAQMFKNMMS